MMSNELLIKMFLGGISSVQPEHLIVRNIAFNKSTNIMNIVNRQYDLNKKNLHVIGAGKAVYQMVQSLIGIVGSQIRGGIVAVPKGSVRRITQKQYNIKYFEGAQNNMPDHDAVAGAQEIVNLVKTLRDDSMLVVLLSGGGSALLPLPMPPITLEEKKSVIKDLVRSGASINELNTVRKKLSSIKGGKLAQLAPNITIVALILSDVIGDPIDLIASGPTVQDLDNINDAIRIIEKYELKNKIPTSVYQILYNENVQFDIDKSFNKRVFNHIIGNNSIALESVRQVACNCGYNAVILSNSVQGDVKDLSEVYLRILKIFCEKQLGKVEVDVEEKIKKILVDIGTNDKYYHNIINLLNSESERSVCLILGGEPTVQLKGLGKGGRSQELALRLSALLQRDADDVASVTNLFNIEFLCAGTDGIDGPTDAAGALGYSSLVRDSSEENLNVEKFILHNDSYNFYSNFKNGKYHIKIGHTNTNVMDIHIMIMTKKVY